MCLDKVKLFELLLDFYWAVKDFTYTSLKDERLK